MLSKGFILKLFEGFSIQRWNDFIRPIELIEMDKHSLKMMIAYFFGKYEEEKGNKVDWEFLVKAGFFDMLKKISLSDIKSPVYKKIKEKSPDALKKLNEWAVNHYEIYMDEKMYNEFYSYVVDENYSDTYTLRILKAANKFSTKVEFSLLQKMGLDKRCDKIINIIESEIGDYDDLECVKALRDDETFQELVDKVELLRYQYRWNQSPRVPKTTVLGHCMFVASLAFMMSDEIDACPKRKVNNFFAGLFHDLMEAVTRDIISPVKRATEELPDVIKDIEKEIAEEELYPFIYYGKNEIEELLEHEFETKIILNGEKVEVTSEEINEKYNEDRYSPIDGDIVKAADELAAFVEAYQSKSHGISSKHLESGIEKIGSKYSKKKVAGINFGKLYSNF